MQRSNYDCGGNASFSQLRGAVAGRRWHCKEEKERMSEYCSLIFLFLRLKAFVVSTICVPCRLRIKRALLRFETQRLTSSRPSVFCFCFFLSFPLILKNNRYVAGKRMTEEQLVLVLNSLGDGNAYVAACRHPVDRMINYLKKYFDPNKHDAETSLAIASGREGSCLTHDHATQYKFVMQTLQLWREIQNQMFRLWLAADHDLLNERNPYRLYANEKKEVRFAKKKKHRYNTGQGLHRVQSAPHVSSCMQNILGTVKVRILCFVQKKDVIVFLFFSLELVEDGLVCLSCIWEIAMCQTRLFSSTS
jgi:hypothetical protein